MTEDERQQLATTLGRIEGRQEAHQRAMDRQDQSLSRLDDSLQLLHRDTAALDAKLDNLKERVGKLEPTVIRHDQTDAEQRGARRQDAKDDASRNAVLALVISVFSVVVAFISRFWNDWTGG